ncbi:MAG: type I-C CRISPR-associated endonuclease Cas1c [Ignavibacteria bacterium]
MRKLLNTLYVTKDGSYLRRERETIVIEFEKKDVFRVPAINIENIVCIGYSIMASPGLMQLTGEYNIGLAFYGGNGEFYARVQGAQSGNVLLRRRQYRLADESKQSTDIARWIVGAKVSNSRTILQRCLRNYPENQDREHIEKVIIQMAQFLNQLKDAGTTDEIRGIEGYVANQYFSCFNSMITTEKEAFRFVQRSRRPPLDRINALLSFVYMLIYHDVSSALEGVGLDPAVGFLHKDRPGRSSLALDIMEELRGYTGDRQVIGLINLKQIKPDGFTISDTGAVLMDKETRAVVIETYQKKKHEEIMHPYLEEKIKIGLIPYVQAQLMARYIRGDMECYPPFLIK